MKSFTTVKDLRDALSSCRNGIVGFVPTMGALHDGHASLVKRARKECDTVVVSVFVNPTQFNDKSDLKSYPRTPEKDAKLLEEAGADFVLFPSVEEIYPEPDTRVFNFSPIDQVMEGKSRPGHFNGVAQVVSRLFAIVEPTKAYFGEKDFQQIAIVRAMVSQLHMNVEIVDCPIIREKDGLARSSRNTLLDREHREAAPHIYEVLKEAVKKVGTMSPAELTKWVEEAINQNPALKCIYFFAADGKTMQRVESWEESKRIQGCVAVQAGSVRLIDNIRLK